MKHITTFVLTLLSCAALCSCNPEDPEKPDKPGQDKPASIEFQDQSNPSPVISANAETVTVSFTATAPWEIDIQETRSGVSWCSVKPMSGGAGESEIAVSVQENDSSEDRVCIVTIKSGGDSVASFDVRQKGVTVEDTQKRILSEFYSALGGDGWTNHSNWKSDAPLSDWYGVKTRPDGTVRVISLKGNKLKGKLPASIAKLNGLDSLLLAGNSISGPVPAEILGSELWQRTWGDIVFNNDITLSEFKGYKVKVPDDIRKEYSGSDGYPVLMLQWDPRKGSMTDKEYGKLLEYYDGIVQLQFSGVPVCGRCVNIPKQELADSVSRMAIPWDSVASDFYYPLSQAGYPTWVIYDSDGVIIDTNLLWDKGEGPSDGSSGGSSQGGHNHMSFWDFLLWLLAHLFNINSSFPEVAPFEMSLQCPMSLDPFDPAFTETNWTIFNSISYTCNKKYNESDVRIEVDSSQDWLRFHSDGRIIVNGNASTGKRFASIRVYLYYKGRRFDTAKINVTQNGVEFSLKTKSNTSEFDLLRNVHVDNTTVFGYTPYPSSITLKFDCNANEVFNPLYDDAFHAALEGDSFYSDGAIPEVIGDGVAPYYDYDVRYDSNRSLEYRGAILAFAPIVYVVDDWNVGTLNRRLIKKNDGSTMFSLVDVIQTPILAYAEYDAYVSEAIAANNAEIAGYNKLKAYSNLSSLTVATDKIKVYSNVSWAHKDLSFEDESWDYRVINPSSFTGDGKTIKPYETAIYVNDYLKEKEYDSNLGKYVYRTHKTYPSRSTYMWLNIDLLDGLKPVAVGATEIYQAGIPAMEFTSVDMETCKEGEYEYSGKTYRFANPITAYYNVYMDELANCFLSSSNITITSSNNSWIWGLSTSSSSHSGTYYSNDDDGSLLFDAYFRLRNGVEVRAHKPYKLSYHVVSSQLASNRPAAVPAQSRRRAAPKLMEPLTIHVPERFGIIDPDTSLPARDMIMMPLGGTINANGAQMTVCK